MHVRQTNIQNHQPTDKSQALPIQILSRQDDA